MAAGDKVRNMADHMSSTHRKQRRKQELGQGYKVSKSAPTKVPPPTRLYFLEI